MLANKNKFSAALKDRTLELFLQGMGVVDIIKQLKEETGVAVDNQTIYRWAKVGGWNEKRIAVRTQVSAEIEKTAKNSLIEMAEGQLEDYGKIRKKGSKELNILVFDKAIDAARAVDIAIQGERRVMQGVVGLNFARDVMRVLLDEIHDEDTLRRIAAKLQKLVSEISQ